MYSSNAALRDLNLINKKIEQTLRSCSILLSFCKKEFRQPRFSEKPNQSPIDYSCAMIEDAAVDLRARRFVLRAFGLFAFL